MIHPRSLKQYKEQSINLSRPEEVVLMLYDGAIRFLNNAVIEYEEKKDVKEKARLVEKAVKVIDHLQSCLDMEKGDEIARNLDRLYSYILVTLTEANMKNDMERIRQCRGLIETIREGWLSVCDAGKRQRDLRPSEKGDEAQSLQKKGLTVRI